MSEIDGVRAFHFIKADHTTYKYGLPVEVGQTLRVEGELVACKNGLHSSDHPFDALMYAPGPVLCVVERDPDAVPRGNPVDKHAGRWRRCIQMKDISDTLRRFAYWNVDEAIGFAADACEREGMDEHAATLRALPEVVDEDTRKRAGVAARAVWHAARAAALYAARYTAWAALYAARAARDADLDAALDAQDAAWAATWAANHNGDKHAFVEHQRAVFAEMVEEAMAVEA